MTVEQLREYLKDKPADMKVLLRHDEGEDLYEVDIWYRPVGGNEIIVWACPDPIGGK